MQKLKDKVKRLLGNDVGSSIVGVVALCSVMAIGVAGLMGVSRNTVSQEVDDYYDTRAFLAAEGGLRLVTNWVAQAINEGGLPNVKLGEDNITIDGIPVKVEVRKSVGLTGEMWKLASTANVSGLPYTKTVERVIEVVGFPGTGDVDCPEQPSGQFGFYVDNGWTDAGINDMLFSGPTHFNTALKLSNLSASIKSGNNPVFMDRVTLVNRKSRDCTNCGIEGGYGFGTRLYNSGLPNDYTYGLEMDSKDVNDLDKVFYSVNSTYNPNAEEQYVRIEHPNNIRIDILDNGQTIKRLVGNNIEDYTLVNLTTPRIVFGTDGSGTAAKPYYDLYNGTTHLGKIPYDIGNELIISTPLASGLTIKGNGSTMSGKVTVETSNPNATLEVNLIDAHLTYTDINLTSNELAAKSGSKDKINISNTNQTNLDNSENILAIYSATNVHFIVPGTGNNRNRAVTAQIFAKNGLVTTSDDKNATVNVIGSVVMKEWYNDVFNMGHDWLKWKHDNRDVNGPGISWTDKDGNTIVACDPEKGTPGVPYVLKNVKWSEHNCPLGTPYNPLNTVSPCGSVTGS